MRPHRAPRPTIVAHSGHVRYEIQRAKNQPLKNRALIVQNVVDSRKLGSTNRVLTRASLKAW
jgi:hypothetical protein